MLIAINFQFFNFESRLCSKEGPDFLLKLVQKSLFPVQLNKKQNIPCFLITKLSQKNVMASLDWKLYLKKTNKQEKYEYK